MKIKIRSVQIIKPSKPTPKNQRTLKLSLIDQLAPYGNINLIFYYKSGGEINIPDRCSQLVKSLSEVLTLFHPLAGRVTEDGLEVDCSDQGVNFLETQVSMRLEDFLEQGPTIDLLSELIGAPRDQVITTLLTVQVNLFDCGALVIGVSASHKVTDTCNLVRFINKWASINCTGGNNDAFSPSFDTLDSHFPPMKISSSSDQNPNLNDPKEKIISKRFLFNGAAISKLRAKASSSPNHRYTRVTLVTAIIWKAVIFIDQVKSGILRNCLLFPPMNLRRKAGSPISESSFGNVWAPYTIRFLQNELTHQSKFVDLVSLIDGTTRNIIRGIQKASGEEICTQTLACYAEAAEELKQNKFCLFTSWCSFPIYEADFGWGKPFWISPVDSLMVQMVTIIDDKHGDGIEAWVCLQEKDMYLFEQDEDIIAFTS